MTHIPQIRRVAWPGVCPTGRIMAVTITEAPDSVLDALGVLRERVVALQLPLTLPTARDRRTAVGGRGRIDGRRKVHAGQRRGRSAGVRDRSAATDHESTRARLS